MARRWEREIRRLPPDAERLVVWNVDALENDEWEQLEQWVANGGTAILAIDQASRLTGSTRETDQHTAGSAAASPVTAGVGRVSTGGGVFSLMREGVLTLITAPDGTPVLVTWTHGRGRFYWSADTGWLTNEHVGQDDNLPLALSLLLPAQGRLVYFDELHHGFRAADTWWQLLRGHLRWFVVIVALAAAVLFWAYGTRFGAPVPTQAGPARASVEYIISMSQLYRRAGARAVVLQNLHRSLMRDLSRLLGGTEGLSHREIARRTAERTGLAPDRIEAALEQTKSLVTNTQKDLILLSREVEAIQRSVHNAGYRDQRRPGTGAK